MARKVKFLKGEPHFNLFFALDRALEGDVVAATSTTVTVSSAEGHTIVFTGSFTVNGLDVTAGTATGFDLYAGSTRLMTARGYAESVDAVGAAIDAGAGDFVTLFFSGAKVIGSKANETIFAGPNSKILGRDGDDRLASIEPGAVVMKGGDGDDVLMGNGSGQLFGGKGDDIFFFVDPAGGADRARGFSVKDDVVGLSPELFAIDVPVGYLGKAYFRVGTAAQTPTEVVLYDKKSGALQVDPDGSGAIAPFQVAILPDHLKLKAHDIIVEFFF